MKHTKLLIISSFFCFYACTSDKINEESTTTTNIELDSDLVKIQEKADSSWGILNQHEITKIQLLKRLGEEISYNPKHSPIKLSQLNEKLKKFEGQLLTPESLELDSSIEKYDEKIDMLISEAINLASNTPDMENYKTAEDLILEINELNSTTALQDRINYSNCVKEHNEYISTHKKELKKKSIAVKPKASFFIEN